MRTMIERVLFSDRTTGFRWLSLLILVTLGRFVAEKQLAFSFAKADGTCHESAEPPR